MTDPELGEARKFLARAFRCVDREAAGRGAVALSRSKGAEIARAQENQHFVLVFRRVERVVDAKAGKTRAAEFLGVDLVLSIIEIVGVEADLAHPAGRDLVDPDRLLEIKARVKERQLEGALGAAPVEAVGAIADVPVLVVGQRGELLGQLVGRVDVRLRGERFRSLRDVVEAQRPGGRGRQPRGHGERRRA
jgi:hypothetical protein